MTADPIIKRRLDGEALAIELGFNEEAWRFVSEFVDEWVKGNGHPRTKGLLILVMEALGGNVYPRGMMAHLVPTQDVTTTREHESARDYAVEKNAEHDGVWVVSHCRPSGRMPREARSLHFRGQRARRVIEELQK
jgi:hypothetical protein